MKEITNTGAELLREAIIRQACMDYYRSCLPPKRKPKVPEGKNPDVFYQNYERARKRTKKQCEDFFKSTWWDDLCGLNGIKVMEALYQKRLKGKKGLKKGNNWF